MTAASDVVTSVLFLLPHFQSPESDSRGPESSPPEPDSPDNASRYKSALGLDLAPGSCTHRDASADPGEGAHAHTHTHTCTHTHTHTHIHTHTHTQTSLLSVAESRVRLVGFHTHTCARARPGARTHTHTHTHAHAHTHTRPAFALFTPPQTQNLDLEGARAGTHTRRHTHKHTRTHKHTHTHTPAVFSPFHATNFTLRTPPSSRGGAPWIRAQTHDGDKNDEGPVDSIIISASTDQCKSTYTPRDRSICRKGRAGPKARRTQRLVPLRTHHCA